MTGPNFIHNDISEWGRFQVVIGDVDRTIYNDVPVAVRNWSLREPFSDAACTLEVQVDSFTPETELPFIPFTNIEINHIGPDGNYVKNLFEGMIESYDDSFSESRNSIILNCIGALYQADYFVRPPVFNDYTFDIGSAIQFELNSRIDYYGLRLQKLDPKSYTNIGSRSRGSWNPLLTGWIQDLLAMAYTDGFMLKGEEACAMVRTDGLRGEGLWCLGNYGTNLSLGNSAPFYGSSSYLTYYVANLYQDYSRYMRDITGRPQNDGFLVLDRGGRVFPYGNAKNLGQLEGIEAWAIHYTPSGDGYWIMDNRGQVWHYGDAAYYGSLNIPGGDLPPVNGFADATVDLVPTPEGHGYYMLTRCGGVKVKGGAVWYGNGTFTNRFFAAMAVTPSGDGYYLVDTLGRVQCFGDAVHRGELNSPDHWVVDIALSDTGNGYALLLDSGAIRYFGDFQTLGSVEYSPYEGPGGNIYQWTLRKDPERRLKLAVKDVWTIHWTVDVGAPGVTHDLTHDFSWAANAYYGEGIDPTNCRWRNSKYPNIHPDDAPLWPGYNFSVHQNPDAAGVLVWQRKMVENGWGLTEDGFFDWTDDNVCRAFQTSAGILVDGIVGPQTWAATFHVGENAGDLNGAYFATIAQKDYVEPFLYNANGAISGPNPAWDRNAVRIERYDNYGEKVKKEEAVISAQSRLYKESGPNFAGSITLKTDPLEGHRFDIREGQNILYRGFKGVDVLFHIAEVSFDVDNLSVTCTVDTAARDAMTIANIYARTAELENPSRTRTRYTSSSRVVEDTIAVWDCVAAGSMVETAKGAKPIESVEVGENVWTWNAGEMCLKPVQRAESRGVKEVYEIKTGRRTIAVTANHRMLVEGEDGIGWAYVRDLRPGDRIVVSGEIPERDDSTVIDPDYAWLLGVLTADGNLSQRGTVNFCVFGDLRNQVISVVKRLFGLDPRAVDAKHGVNFYSNEWYSDLLECGIEKRSAERHVPHMIKMASHDAQIAYLEGYVQGDRHIDEKGHFKYTTANVDLAKELRALNMALGYPVSNLHVQERKNEIIIKGKTVKNAKPLNRFSVMPDVTRGQYRIDGVERFELATIRSIESAGEVETFDLQVADTHNFIAEGVVTHNCENGSGVIPRHGIYQGLWNVIRIPAGEFGQVISTTIQTDVPAQLVAAVFDRPITANDLQVRGDPSADNFWAEYPEDGGLVIAWGGEGCMAGYYPGRCPGSSEEGDPVTGVLVDRASWNYWTTQPPWLWVALYSDTTTYIQGRMHPGMEGTGSIPDQVAVAEPTGMG